MEITSRDIMKSRNRWYVNIVAILGIIAVLSKGNEAGVCEFCGKDFTVLGRHQWRCKARNFTTLTIDNILRGIVTHILQQQARAGGAGPTTPTLVGPKILPFKVFSEFWSDH